MRLLDIDKVIEALRSDYNNGTCGGVDYDQTDAAAFEEALGAAYKEHGEAEPVRRGRWRETDSEEPCFYYCSNCRCQWDDETDYCPSCGAKMERNENESD